MFAALKTRPIKGCTAAVCEIDPTVKEIKANKILNFSSFHSFSYEKNGLRMLKAFEIGSGQLLSWSTLQVEIPDGNLSAKPVSENLDFWDVLPRFVQLQKEADSESSLFECNKAGCSQSFESFDAFQDHVNFGHHTLGSANQESTYDKLRREWVLKFSAMTISEEAVHQFSASTSATTASEPLKAGGWALQKLRGSGTRFSERVKQYLQSCFDLGVQTGRKADPAQVSADMRTVKTADGQRVFSPEEWLTKFQIKGFFSRLAAAQRKRTTGKCSAGADTTEEEDEELLQKELARILSQIALGHPIQYENHDICSLSKARALTKFTMEELRAMCDYFELPRKSGDRKSTLIDHVSNMVKECSC